MILSLHRRPSRFELTLVGGAVRARGEVDARRSGRMPALGAPAASATGTWLGSSSIEGSSTKPRQSYPCLVGSLANGLDREVDAA